MSQTQPVVINFKGGIVSPGSLKDILTIAAGSQVSYASFGLRQQLLMDIPVHQLQRFKTECTARNISVHENDTDRPNTVSSYGAVNIFSQESWLSEGVYKDVFDLFNYEPRLKINICDSKQNLTPFFTGHLNWLSSEQVHFWHLYLRLPGTGKLFCWPELIYTNDIAKVSAAVMQLLNGAPAESNGDQHTETWPMVPQLKELISYISRPLSAPVRVPVFHLPYYEGFNKDGDTYWLGIYRRNELFPVNFLKDLCTICLQTKIGHFYSTPWKSIIIKGIQNNDRNLWDHVLGKYRINVRHAANELNWQVEDQNEDGLILKRHVIRHFDKEDVRTFGLSFAVKTKPSSVMFGSVLISKQPLKNASRLKSMDRFDIFYKKDFNPNSTELVLHRKGVTKDQIGTYLVSLCKDFYEQGNHNEILIEDNQLHSSHEVAKPLSQVVFYQCRLCLSVYDEQETEGENQSECRTPLNGPPDNYHCPLCDAGKEEFVPVEESTLIYKSPGIF